MKAPVPAIALVSLEEVKNSLRIEHDDDDKMLELLISAASERIILYFKNRVKEVLSLDDSGIPTKPIPTQISISAIIYVGILYRNIDQDPDHDWREGARLPAIITANLYPFRDPTLA